MACVFLCGLLCVSPAWAETERDTGREQARSLAYSALRAYSAGDYASASRALDEAFRLLPVPSVGLWSARALVKLGKLVEAEERYFAAMRLPVEADDPPVQHAAKRTAELEYSELLPRIPSLRIRVVGAEAQQVAVSVGGVAVPSERLADAQRLNPGRHSVVGARAGERCEVSLTLTEGQHEEAVLHFTSTTAAPALTRAAGSGSAVVDGSAAAARESSARPWRTAAWVGVGVGGASLAGAAISYFVARDKYRTLETDGVCRNDRCRPGAALDDYYDVRSVYLVSVLAGSVLTAAGVTLLLLDPDAPRRDQPSAMLRLDLGLDSVNLVGKF